MIHGNDLLILNSSGNALIAGSTSCEIDIQKDLLETSSPDSGKYRTYIAGRVDWTINVAYLVSAPLVDLKTIEDDQPVTIRVKVRGENNYLQGSALFQTCHITATRGNLSQGTFVLRGNGKLEYPET